MIHSFMWFQLKLLVFWTFLLSALIFGHSHKVTVKVAGTVNCRDCIEQEHTTSKEHSGLHVTVHCDFQSRETKTHGTSSVDNEGKFNVTLSVEIMEDKYSKHRCYATLKSASTRQCPIHKDQTASVKNMSFHHSATQILQHIHNPIVFSPVTCQSAFFWPFFTLPPKPEFMLPYPLPPTAYTPSAPPAPLPPRIPNSPMTPSLPPMLPPSGQECGDLFPPKPAPPSSKTPVYETPSPLLLPPTTPPSSPSAAPVLSPFPIPNEKLSPPLPGILLTPPTHYREPNPIPRPPPLPPMTTVVPRKFINPPKP